MTTATLIGDPPNILIAGATGLSFGSFIVNPSSDRVAVALLCVAVFWVTPVGTPS